jgi:hypothetical protein
MEKMLLAERIALAAKQAEKGRRCGRLFVERVVDASGGARKHHPICLDVLFLSRLRCSGQDGDHHGRQFIIP